MLNMFASPAGILVLIFGPVAESIRFVPDTTYKDRRPSSGQLWTVEKVSSIGSCAIECYKYKECTSFFYGKKTKTCLGFAYNAKPELSELVNEEGWSYFHDDTLTTRNEGAVLDDTSRDTPNGSHTAVGISANIDVVTESPSGITPIGNTVTTALIVYTPSTMFAPEDAEGTIAPQKLLTEPVPKGGDTEEPGCRGERWKAFEKSCYKFSESKARWLKASERCQKKGGYLVEITSPEEDRFIAELMSQPGNDQRRWIGANDRDNEGDWRWIGSGTKVEYANWREGEPNNHGFIFRIGLLGEDCAHIDLRSERTTEWNDNDCFWKVHFICERSMIGYGLNDPARQ